MVKRRVERLAGELAAEKQVHFDKLRAGSPLRTAIGGTARNASVGMTKVVKRVGGKRVGKKRICNRKFATYKLRGEWVELLFMARAAERGFNVSKPWGDSARYDVSAEQKGRFRRVQIKSTTVPRGDGGYVCYLKRTGIRYYRVSEVDYFAIYVVPKDAWFILPSRVVLRLKSNIRVAPGHAEQKYARYEEAWESMLPRRRRGRRR